MLARAAPAPLPDRVLDDVRRLGARAAAALGPVRFEWSHDGRTAWVVQLHQAASTATRHHHPPGHPGPLAPVRPGPRPRAAAPPDRAVDPGDGIELTGDVGVTSHAGDLLRRAAIPSRLAHRA